MGDYESEKLHAFGSWLTSRKVVLTGELYALSINCDSQIDLIRKKAGHLEAISHALEAFTELYQGDLTTFMKDRLGADPVEDD